MLGRLQVLADERAAAAEALALQRQADANKWQQLYQDCHAKLEEARRENRAAISRAQHAEAQLQHYREKRAADEAGDRQMGLELERLRSANRSLQSRLSRTIESVFVMEADQAQLHAELGQSEVERERFAERLAEASVARRDFEAAEQGVQNLEATLAAAQKREALLEAQRQQAQDALCVAARSGEARMLSSRMEESQLHREELRLSEEVHLLQNEARSFQDTARLEAQVYLAESREAQQLAKDALGRAAESDSELREALQRSRETDALLRQESEALQATRAELTAAESALTQSTEETERRLSASRSEISQLRAAERETHVTLSEKTSELQHRKDELVQAMIVQSGQARQLVTVEEMASQHKSELQDWKQACSRCESLHELTQREVESLKNHLAQTELNHERQLQGLQALTDARSQNEAQEVNQARLAEASTDATLRRLQGHEAELRAELDASQSELLQAQKAVSAAAEDSGRQLDIARSEISQLRAAGRVADVSLAETTSELEHQQDELRQARDAQRGQDRHLMAEEALVVRCRGEMQDLEQAWAHHESHQELVQREVESLKNHLAQTELNHERQVQGLQALTDTRTETGAHELHQARLAEASSEASLRRLQRHDAELRAELAVSRSELQQTQEAVIAAKKAEESAKQLADDETARAAKLAEELAGAVAGQDSFRQSLQEAQIARRTAIERTMLEERAMTEVRQNLFELTTSRDCLREELDRATKEAKSVSRLEARLHYVLEEWRQAGTEIERLREENEELQSELARTGKMSRDSEAWAADVRAVKAELEAERAHSHRSEQMLRERDSEIRRLRMTLADAQVVAAEFRRLKQKGMSGPFSLGM